MEWSSRILHLRLRGITNKSLSSRKYTPFCGNHENSCPKAQPHSNRSVLVDLAIGGLQSGLRRSTYSLFAVATPYNMSGTDMGSSGLRRGHYELCSYIQIAFLDEEYTLGKLRTDIIR